MKIIHEKRYVSKINPSWDTGDVVLVQMLSITTVSLNCSTLTATHKEECRILTVSVYLQFFLSSVRTKMAAVNISAMWSREVFSAPVLMGTSWHLIKNPAISMVRVLRIYLVFYSDSRAVKYITDQTLETIKSETKLSGDKIQRLIYIKLLQRPSDVVSSSPKGCRLFWGTIRQKQWRGI